MKINEIITEDIRQLDEGFWDSVSKGAESFAKGAGLNASAAALGAYNKTISDPTQADRFTLANTQQAQAERQAQAAQQAAPVDAQTQDLAATRAAKQKAASEKIHGPQIVVDPETAAANIIAARKKAQSLDLPKAPTAPPVPTAVPAGKRLEVTNPKNNGKFYKTSTGWTNALGQKVTDPGSVAFLEKLSGTGKLISDPAATATAPAKPVARRTKTTRPTRGAAR